MTIETLGTRAWLAWSGRAPEVEADWLRREASLRSGSVPVLQAISRDGDDESARTGVAVVRISGPLYARSVSWRDSYEEIAAVMNALAADATVKGVLLRIDSPGGEVANLRVAGDAIKAAAKAKPVWAVADPMAASAAYWLASQASRLLVSPGAMAGSIGTIIRHVDQTGRAEQMGVKITEVVFGSRKNEFSSFKALDDEALERLQAVVDEAGEEFVAAVAAGRRMKPEAVRATEGRIFSGAEAIELGLADGEASFGEALAGLIARVRGTGLMPGAAVDRLAESQSGQEQGGEMADQEKAGAQASGAAPPLPDDAVGSPGAKAQSENKREARQEPAAPRVDMNELHSRMAQCGLKDFELASRLQERAASTEDAAQIAQLYMISGKAEWLRAHIDGNVNLKADAVRVAFANHRAEEDERTAINSAALPGEGMGRAPKKRSMVDVAKNRYAADNYQMPRSHAVALAQFKQQQGGA